MRVAFETALRSPGAVLLNWGLGWRFFCNAAIYMVGSLLAMILLPRMLALEALYLAETVYDVGDSTARFVQRKEQSSQGSHGNRTVRRLRQGLNATPATLERLDIDACRASSSIRIRAQASLALVFNSC